MPRSLPPKLLACARIAVVLAFAAVAPAAADNAAPPPDAFRSLNDTAIAIYQDAKHRFLAAQDPVVIVGFDGVVIRHNGTVRRVGRLPPVYDILKSVGHLPRSLWAALRPAIEGLDPGEAWRKDLSALRPRAEAALAALPDAGLSPEATRRDAAMLKAGIGLIDLYLAHGLPTRAQLQDDLRVLAPTILADAAEAARAQIDAMDRDIRPWWESLTQAERDRTFVLVLGPKTPRDGNVAYAYFVDLLGRAEDGHRVVYAEGIFDEAGADRLLATLLTDRRLSVDFFVDERRMERDLLADGAEARLLELFGRLGTP